MNKKQDSIFDVLHDESIYNSTDESILVEQRKAQALLDHYNLTFPDEREKRFALLQEMFASFGEESYIEPPFHANWGGRFVHIGKFVYANSNLTLVDDTHIYIGDYTKLGPNVVIATPGHPILPSLREKGAQFNLPVSIGRNCWLGSGVIVLPGVTIGDNTVIGAGSVVTKDIPANVVAFGNPCQVVREINEHDASYYYKDKKIPQDIFKILGE